MKISGDSDLAYIIFCCLSSSPQKNTWWVSERGKDGVIDSISDKKIKFSIFLSEKGTKCIQQKIMEPMKGWENLVPLKTVTPTFF